MWLIDIWAVDARPVVTGRVRQPRVQPDSTNAIEQLDDLLFDEHRSQIQTVQRRSFQLRTNLVVLRRVVLRMRDVLNTLLRRDLQYQRPTMPR
jgi:hypothetical protein